MEMEHEFPDALVDGPARGRGAQLNPANRFESVRLHVLGEHVDHLSTETTAANPPRIIGRQAKTQIFEDQTRTLVNRVDSPDIGFKWTINPYRGCEHGCIYCYARPTHELLGLSSGLDFETKLFAKVDAPAILRRELARPSWQAETIVMSGVTDCYQPIEAELKITQQCLEVLAACHQPVSIVTKSRLVLRDLDLLRDLAASQAVHVAVSVTTLDRFLAARLEPRAGSPMQRLETIQRLTEAGVPTSVMVAPIVPGLTDREVPDILKAAACAGATSAAYVLLRLPHQLKALFRDWLCRHLPERACHVESLICQTQGGKLYDSTYRVRHRGQGPIAQHIHDVFRTFARRERLDQPPPRLSNKGFLRPVESIQQLRLF